MTTIVVKGLEMASDSRCTSGDFIESDDYVKIKRIGGCLVGCAGSALSSLKFQDWFTTQLEHQAASEAFPFLDILMPEDMVEKDFIALVLYDTGEIYEFYGTASVFPISGEYTAIGSGKQYALCALDTGCNIEEAIRVACKRDIFSGGEMQLFSLEPVALPQLVKEDLNKLTKKQLIDMLTEADVE
jgi:ATP-dependent protease HslVU (ClpYQ) peptidase subunit